MRKEIISLINWPSRCLDNWFLHKETLKQVIQRMTHIKATINVEGYIGSWLGRLRIVGGEARTEAQAENTNKLIILMRNDFLTVEAQRAFQNRPIIRQIREQQQDEGVEVEYASLDLAGLVSYDVVAG